MSIKKWYNTNFSKSIILNGKETFHFWIENNTESAGSKKDLYLLVIPDVPDQDLTVAETSSISINGANLRDISRTLKNYTIKGGAKLTVNADPLPGTGTVTSITVVDGGGGYIGTPTLTLNGGLGVGGVHATLTANMSGGSIASVTVDTPGSGYEFTPTLTISGETEYAQPSSITNYLRPTNTTWGADPNRTGTYNLLSIPGWHRYEDGGNFISNLAADSNDFFTMLLPPNDGIVTNPAAPTFKTNVWHTIQPNARTNFRVDYDGEADENVKLTFIITDTLPSADWPVVDKIGTNPNPAGYTWSNLKNGDVVFYYNNDVYMYRKIGIAPFYEEMSLGLWKNQYDDFASSIGDLMGIKLLHMYGDFNDINDTKPLIDFQETHIQCYVSNETKTSRDIDYWIEKDLYGKPIIPESTSYALTRTNPKISGNIKLVTDSTGQIYLESINANEELSNSKFKKREIAANGDYANDLKTVFGTVEPSSLFQVYQKDPVYENTKRDFVEQYDFFYGAGVSLESSKLYDEEFAIFAPLWIRKDLPEYFVIFKNDNPVNLSTYTGGSNIDIINESLSTAQIVKTFDLRPGSKLGTYLNNIVTDDRFKEMPVSVNYDNNELTTWFGASYIDGTVSEKGSYLYDYYREDRPILEFENEITSGFENNGIVSMNLINLDFKFDDVKSDEYSINRYFGLYMNAIQLAEFNVYADGLQSIEQTPAPRIGLDGEAYSSTPYVVENNDGVLIPIDYIHDDIGDTLPTENNLLSGRLPILSDLTNPMRFFYVMDRDANFDRATNLVRTETLDKDFDSIRINTKSKDLQKYGGISNLSIKNEAILTDKHEAFIKLDLSNDGNFREVIKTGENFTLVLADHVPGDDIWKITANPTGLNPGQAWVYPVYDVTTNEWLNTFSPDGTPEQVASAIAKCINNFTETLFTAFSNGGSVYIGFYSAGSINNGITFTRNMIYNSPIENLKFFGLNKNLDEIIQFTSTTSAGNIELVLTENNTMLADYQVKLENIVTKEITFSRKDRDGSDVPIYKGTLQLNNDDQYEIVQPEFTITFLNNYDIYSNGDIWTYEKVIDSISQNFVGGSDLNKNSAIIAKENIINIDANTYFQAAKNDYSTIKNWNVQGQDLLFLDNVDFINKTVKDSVTIYLSDLNKQFYVGDDNNITGFDVYSAKFGIFSIIPFKEFDTDLILSSYSYGPYDELLKYYGSIELKKGESVELGLSNHYMLKGGQGYLEGVRTNGNKDEIENWVNFPDANITLSPGDNPHTKDNILFNTFTPSRAYDIYNLKINAPFDSSTSPGTSLYFPHVMENETQKYASLIFNATGDELSVITNYSYTNDNDLKDFEGFFILQDVIHESDIDVLTELKANNDIARFTYTAVSSEYERLREISTKDLATTSKVVPYINKWVMRNKDVRDNPYRLNNSLAFGMTNFSPLLDNQQIDPKLHSHEFFYIDSFPKDFDPDNLPSHRLYFYDKLDKVVFDGKSWLELMRTDKGDWFTKYFTLGYPTEQYDGESVEMNRQIRFGLFKAIPNIDIVQTVFHGAKIQLENANGANTDYDDYKISAIMKLVKPTQFSSSSPVNFEIITNKINKTILIVGTLEITDYKITDGIDYTFMYASKSALRNSNMLDVTKEAGVWEDQVINGMSGFDWGLANGFYSNKFNKRSESQLATGYSSEIMNEYQIGAGVTEFADIKLNFSLQMRSATKNVSVSSNEYNLVSLNNYPFVAKEEIKPINGSLYDMSGAYLTKNATFNTGTYNGLIESFNQGEYGDITQQYKGQPVSDPSDQIYTIKLMRNYYYVVTDANKLFVVNEPGTLPETSKTIGTSDSIRGFATATRYNLEPTYLINEDTNTWYIQGGEKFNETILRKFSFGSMVDLIRSDSPLVTYTTIGGDGIAPRLKFIENDVIYKTNKLTPVIDRDKPQIYKNKEVIGFVYEDNNVTDTIYRHRGDFEPKTREIMYSWIRENETMTTAYDMDFLGANTQLLPHNNFGISRNMYFNKVANEEILKISTAASSESAYKSLYAYINEIAIDHDNFSLFKTTWDASYFKIYETINKHTEIDGINVLKESKSFFGSKVMNVPNDIYIETFKEEDFYGITVKETANPIQLDTEKSKAVSLANTTSADTTSYLKINLDVTQRIIDLMVEGGAPNEFKKLVNDGILPSDADITYLTEEYLRLNIIDLYYIEDIKLYVKDFADKRSDPRFIYTLSDYDKQLRGYVEDKNAQIETVTNLQSIITKNLKAGNWQSFALSINVRRI